MTVNSIFLLLLILTIILFVLFHKRKAEKQPFIKSKFQDEPKAQYSNIDIIPTSGHYPYLRLGWEHKMENARTPELITRNDSFGYKNENTVLTGRHELYLYESLVRKLGRDKLLFGSYTLYGFYPDIIYINKAPKIYIDIEIDEPYSSKTGEPLHYVEICENEVGKKFIFDSNKDRDDAFIKYGWTVVRFSEEQIIKSVEDCVDVVVHIINYLLKKPSQFSFEDSILKISKRWTKKEAMEMALNKTRNIEPIIILEKTNFEKELKEIENEYIETNKSDDFWDFYESEEMKDFLRNVEKEN